MPHKHLAQRISQLATQVWYRLVNQPGGPPGTVGPPGGNEPWDEVIGTLAGAIETLEQVLEQPDPNPNPNPNPEKTP